MKDSDSLARKGSRPRRLASRLFVLIALPLAVFILPAALMRFMLPALSPFLGFGGALAAHAFGYSILCSLPVLGLLIWRRRWFCRSLCPVGLIVETCAKARPSSRHSYRRVPPLGQWAALLTLGGAAAAWPLFLFLDPVAMLVGATGAAEPPFAFSSLLCATGLLTVIVLSLLFPHLWCERLCPLGGLQTLLADGKDLVRRRNARANESDTAPTTSKASLRFSRRTFAGAGLGLGLALVAKRSLANEGRRLRPPGSVEEAALATLCVRCGTCGRSCPTGIIRPDLAPSQVSGFLLPMIGFENGHCRNDCNRCGRDCPTGAIASLPLDEKNRRKIGLAKIDLPGCLLTVETECSACTMVCKYQAITEKFSRDTYTVVPLIDQEKCNGCGECVAICPEKVIEVERL